MRVVVNGTFDVLHRGHIELLKRAKSFNEGFEKAFVLVLIDSDERVKQLKGPSRPINNQEDRKELLLALKYVDQVEIFNSDKDLVDWIRAFQPDVMVKGSDWRGKVVIGQEYCKSIYWYDRVEPYSTTKTIQDTAGR